LGGIGATSRTCGRLSRLLDTGGCGGSAGADHEGDSGEQDDVSEVEHGPPADVDEIDNAACGEPVSNIGESSTDDQASSGWWVEASSPSNDGDHDGDQRGDDDDRAGWQEVAEPERDSSIVDKP